MTNLKNSWKTQNLSKMAEICSKSWKKIFLILSQSQKSANKQLNLFVVMHKCSMYDLALTDTDSRRDKLCYFIIREKGPKSTFLKVTPTGSFAPPWGAPPTHPPQITYEWLQFLWSNLVRIFSLHLTTVHLIDVAEASWCDTHTRSSSMGRNMIWCKLEMSDSHLSLDLYFHRPSYLRNLRGDSLVSVSWYRSISL